MIEARRVQTPPWILISLVIGAYSALVASTPSPISRAALVAPLALAILAFWTLAAPHRWIAGFMAAALLLPPLPIPLGDSGPHPSLLFAVLGILAGVLWLAEWRVVPTGLNAAFVTLFA